MEKIPISIIDSTDPLGNKVGGDATFIKNFIKFSPRNYLIRYIGIASRSSMHKKNEWKKIYVCGKEILFLPILDQIFENRNYKIPISAQFALQLFKNKNKIEKSILFFNRVEPILCFWNNKDPKLAMVHIDVKDQIYSGKSGSRWNYISFFYDLYERYFLKKLCYIYPVSENSEIYYKKKFPIYKSKINLIENGYDHEIFYPAKSKYHYKNKISRLYNKNINIEPVVIFVGRLTRAKAPFRLLECFDIFFKMLKKGYLLIVGKGELEEEMRKYCYMKGIHKRVIFSGKKQKKDLADLYKASDVLVLTSDTEGFPMVILEALGSGIPVVSTNVGDVQKCVINNYSGEIINSFNPLDIYIGLRKILNSSSKYSSNNCVKCVEDFKVNKKLKKIYAHINNLSQKINLKDYG